MIDTIPVCEHSCKTCLERCHRQQQNPPSVKRAMQILRENTVTKVVPEIIPLKVALNRVTAETTFARLNVPSADRSMHDGIAVHGDILSRCTAHGRSVLEPEEFFILGMGDCLPAGFDTVIPYELLEFAADGRVRVMTLPCRGEGISKAGTSLRSGEQMVPANHRLTPSCLSILRLAGVEQVKVWRKPRAAIIPIGSDLCPPGTTALKPGQSIEADSILIEAIIAECGGESWTTPIVADDTALLGEAVRTSVESCDFIVLVGGVGRGGGQYGDHTRDAVELLGRVFVHGVDFRPGGKNVLFGEIGGKCVVGIPGPPHAAQTQAEEHIPAVMELFLQCPCYERPEIYARADADFLNKENDGYHPHVGLHWDGSEYEIFPIKRGDTVDTFINATGILMPDESKRFYQKGEKIKVRLTYGERTVRMKSP